MGIENKDYCGTIVTEFDGVEYETLSVDDEMTNTAKPVPTMNSKLRPLGSTCGARQYDLTIEVPVPADGNEPDWINMRNGSVRIYPACGGGGRSEIMEGYTVTKVGSKYDVNNEARRTITGHYLEKIYL